METSLNSDVYKEEINKLRLCEFKCNKILTVKRLGHMKQQLVRGERYKITKNKKKAKRKKRKR